MNAPLLADGFSSGCLGVVCLFVLVGLANLIAESIKPKNF